MINTNGRSFNPEQLNVIKPASVWFSIKETGEIKDHIMIITIFPTKAKLVKEKRCASVRPIALFNPMALKILFL
jgi:hypothetical protein